MLSLIQAQPVWSEIARTAFDLAGLAGLVAALTDLYLSKSQARKNTAEAKRTDAEATTQITGAATDLVEAFRKDVAELRELHTKDQKIITKLQTSVEELSDENNGLRHRIVLLEELNRQLTEAILLNARFRRSLSSTDCKRCQQADTELETMVKSIQERQIGNDRTIPLTH